VNRRSGVLCLALLPWLSAANAQSDWRTVAVPFLSPQAWLRSIDERWYAPRAAEFAQATARLSDTLASNCALQPAQRAWGNAMLAWERLSAVQTGALVVRRSARTLDFAPARPAAIERAMAAPDADIASAGSAALGLPALEWLLWRSPLRGSRGPSCAYAQRVAAHLAAEAKSLAADYATPRERDDETTQRDFAALLNQLVGGAATLRWAQIGKPRREGKAQWPRAASGLTRQAWQARTQALQQLLEFHAQADAAVALEPFLRGRGMNPLADRVRQASLRAAVAMAGASPASPAKLPAAEQALAALEQVLGNEVAPALEVTIGFSDADGD
jgi:uncharacterized protein